MARFYAENVEFLSPMFRGDFMLDLEPGEERRARRRPRECAGLGYKVDPRLRETCRQGRHER